MDIKATKEAKESLQTAILFMLKRFEQEHAVSVTQITVYKRCELGKDCEETESIQLKVEL